jgi:hypothetical protein
MKRKEEELKNTVVEMKRKRGDPLQHCKGETDVEYIFDTPCVDYQGISPEKPVRKKLKRQTPTMRSHSQVEHPTKKE